jgi:nucleoside-diphosphate-sugar epimerase
MNRILVTGATGFVGSAIVGACMRAGFYVRATGRISSKRPESSEFVTADLRDHHSLHSLVNGVDAVVHAAGVAHQFGKAARDPTIFASANVEATENIARTAAEARVPHLVVISSVSVYGGGPADEETPCRCAGPYAESKYEAEQCAERIASRTGMGLTILRLATVYGEGDRGNVARLMMAIDRGHFVWIGPGTNRKSLIHRDDVGQAVAACLAHPPGRREVYNVSADPSTMGEIVGGLSIALGRRVPSWRIPGAVARGAATAAVLLFGRGGWAGSLDSTIRKWIGDDLYGAQRFQERFRCRPRIDLSEGLRREVEWYRGLHPLSS